MAVSRNDRARAVRAIEKMAGAVGVALPSVSQIAREKREPFRILISTIISLRTKDEVTMAASKRLFKVAPNAKRLSETPVGTIAKAIYPAGFYKTKAKTLRDVAKRLRDEYGGRVPDTVDELLTFKGVGRKTATLVVSLGYGVPAICVDVHVHRVSNRLGLIDTKNPDESEFALMDLLPQKYWVGYNELLVSFGQQICVPVSPKCSVCPLRRSCPRLGVSRSR
jgi:endonuclease-3